LTVARLSCILMHTGGSSSWIVGYVCLERYTRVLMKASLEFPIYFLKIYSSEHVQMGRVLAVAPMRMEHGEVTTLERSAPDGTVEVVQALRPTAHQCAQHDCGILVKSRAEQRRDRQDDVPIDHALVEDLADLADPVVDGDFGAPQAQRRLTAHRHQVLALATLQAAVLNIAHLVWIPARQHLGHQAIIVGRLVAWMRVLKGLPVIGKNLLEDTPVP
jgi:hypothetical protein